MSRFYFTSFFVAFTVFRLAFAVSAEAPSKKIPPCERASTRGALPKDPLDRLLQTYHAALCARLDRGEVSKKDFEAFYKEMVEAVSLEKERIAVEDQVEQEATNSVAKVSRQGLISEKEKPPARRVEFLPEKLLYRPYVADPRRPRFSIKWLSGDEGESHIQTAIGGYFPFLDIRRPSAPDSAFQVAGFAGSWSRWDTRKSLDQIGTDFRGGLSFSYKRGPWALRLQNFHESDHLGDELIERTGRKRISYRREDIGLGITYALEEYYRLYAEAGYGYILGELNKPWRIQMGSEWEGSPLIAFGGRPFAALDFQTWEESKWDPNINLELGVVYWNQIRSRSFRLSLDLYRGRDPLGEFLRESLRYLSLGFSLDF